MDKEQIKGKPVQKEIKKSVQQPEYWSKHRITLIAYEAQFMNSRKPPPPEVQEPEKTEETVKKRGGRVKIDLQYESGFVRFVPEESEDFEAKKLAKNYPNLKSLFFSSVNKDFLAVRQFIQHLIELKHSTIVQQFCQIYDLILPEIRQVHKETIIPEKSRQQWVESVRDRMVDVIRNYESRFPWMIKFLGECPIETKKLILVEVYCLLAERFGFTENEYYDEATTLAVIERKVGKRVKRSD